MPRSRKVWFWAAVVFVTLSSVDSYANKHRPAEEVVTRLAELERWLGTGPNGMAWSHYLGLPQLKAELGNSAAANATILRETLSKLQSGAAGLDRPQFVAVRRAVNAWLESLPPPPKAELADSFAAVKLRPVADTEFQTAQARLKQSVAALDRYLGSGANGQAWKTYLDWDKLQALTASSGPVGEAELEHVWLRFASGRPGLQLPPFVAVRQALEAYLPIALLHGQPDVEANLQQRLEQMKQLLTAPTEGPAGDTNYTLGQLAGWLDRRGQATDLVADLRKHYAQPNLRMHMSERLISLGVQRSVDRVEPVTDVILGTNISGTGHTIGWVRAQLVPNDEWAVIDSVFSGTTRSRTLGRNGSARINSAGTTNFEARKRLYFDAEGLRIARTSAGATTRTQTLGVSAGRGGLFAGIANGIAADRVAQNKPRAQQIAADHAEDRISSRVDREADPQLAEANQDYLTKIRWPLLDDNAFPASLKFSTSYDYVYGVGTQAAFDQLAANTPPPIHQGPIDAGVQLHESAINNLADSALAGDEIHQKEFQDWVVDLTGRLPDRLKSEPGKAPWMITFAPQRPVTVFFDKGQVTVVLRVHRVEGVVSSRRPWEITAVYQVEKTPGGLRAVRPEPLRVQPPGFKEGDNLGGQVVAERRNIQRQFEEDLFTTPIEHTGLTMPGDWGVKAGKLPLVELVTGDGWILLGWLK